MVLCLGEGMPMLAPCDVGTSAPEGFLVWAGGATHIHAHTVAHTEGSWPEARTGFVCTGTSVEHGEEREPSGGSPPQPCRPHCDCSALHPHALSPLSLFRRHTPGETHTETSRGINKGNHACVDWVGCATSTQRHPQSGAL